MDEGLNLKMELYWGSNRFIWEIVEWDKMWNRPQIVFLPIIQDTSKCNVYKCFMYKLYRRVDYTV